MGALRKYIALLKINLAKLSHQKLQTMPDANEMAQNLIQFSLFVAQAANVWKLRSLRSNHAIVDVN
jgi:hypothetical protein